MNIKRDASTIEARQNRSLLLAALALASVVITGCGGDDDSTVANAESVSCESLSGTTLAGGTIDSAATIPAGDYTPPGQQGAVKALPAFCRVTATMRPSPDSNVKVEVWMPRANWNGRFLGVGGGGGGGAISYGTGIAEGLKRGFAVANTDLGTSPDANLAIDHPERWRDFGYRANHEMTVAGKTLTTAYYQASPRTAYFSGCSTGGQQALSLAQRYPGDYNGIIAGAPANNRTHLHTMFLSNLQVLNAPGAKMSQAKLNMVTSNVIATCGGKDGGAPGDKFLTDPRQCNFDPETLAKCTGTDADNCLTAPQLTALKATWNGPMNPRTRERIFTGLAVGSESAALGLASQADTVTWPLQQLYMFKWALGSTWNYATFDFDTGMDAVDARLASTLNANDPDLALFKSAGGKLMMFNGTSDPGVPFSSPIEYYERVVQAQGGSLSATQEFFRYYQVPGMGHCSSITGGAGVGDFGQSYSQFVPPDADHDMLLKLVDWVENKKAPESVVATKYGDAAGSTIAMERPLCTYPKLPTYQGGDATKASSFQCLESPRGRVPLPAAKYLN